MQKQLTTDDQQVTTYSKLLLLLLVVSSLLLVNAPIGALAHGGVNDDELIIRMTANGFEPRELTVVEDDEILFINNDDTDRWPASNFHPTHTLYPEFDPLKGIPPGESWKTTFKKVGVWKMHDHLIPHFTGKITVLENPDIESSTSTQTIKENFWTKLRNLFLKLFSKDKKISSVVLDDHGKAHLKGQELFKKYGVQGMSRCTPEAAFGCYHGFTETIFTGNSEKEYVDNILGTEKSCRTLGEVGSGPNASCIHGIGHGVVTYRDHDMNISLKDCDTLDNKIRTYCYDGVFMELSISAAPSFYNKDNPIYPCDIVAESYKTGCIRSQVQVMQSRFGMETNAIAQICLNTKNSVIINNCIDSLGLYIAQASSGDPAKIISNCQDISDGAKSAQCMAAAAGELVFQNYVGWQESTKQVCESLPIPYQTSCYERVEQIKQSYGRN